MNFCAAQVVDSLSNVAISKEKRDYRVPML
jgi:hypothetical protein